jgi:hypothetical protein
MLSRRTRGRRRSRSHSRRYKGKGGKKWSTKYKKSINCNRPRGFSQRQYCAYGRGLKTMKPGSRFNQSGGDILNYLPSDVSMALRQVGNSFSSTVDAVKGFAPDPSPLPFNDHKLQKTEVTVSERIPDIKTYYKNAMNLIPAL